MQLSLSGEIAGDVDVEALAQLDADGATVADAIALWNALENPEEMIEEDTAR